MNPVYGASRLLVDLVALGHKGELVTTSKGNIFVVIREFEVPLGTFAGRIIGLGLQATADFPKTVSSAIHVLAMPQLYDKKDTLNGVRNIVDSELGSEWRYWSYNFGWSGDKTTRRLMSQINQIFKDA